MGAVFWLRHRVGPTTHNERETAGSECGTDQFGDNVHEKIRGNILSETLKSKLSEGLQKKMQKRPGGDF